MNLQSLLQDKFRHALTGLVPDPAPYAALVKPAQRPEHGDYQANCAMPLGKALDRKPRDVAEEIVRRLDLGDVLAPPEVAGPGFINLRFQSDWLADQLRTAAADDRLGVAPAAEPRTYVIDYSSPNVAKPLHVGHLRSTIIGAALTRLLQFLGHRVVTDNHLGDWGTQFGMLLYGYKHFRDEAALKADPVREMVRLYLQVRGLTKGTEDDEGEVTRTPEEAAHYARCLEETARLQAGDPENVALWKQFIPWSMGAITPLYDRLGVSFDHYLGESFYNPMLAGVVADLLAKGIATESGGAVVVFLKPPPEDGSEHRADAVVRKKDGAFTYTTTDLATIQYRMTEWKPDAVLYVVGAPQAFHFRTLFEIARRWGVNVELEHIAFGSVLGNDGKILSTRNGGAAELSELLDRAVERGAEKYDQTFAERRERGEDVPDLSPDERRRVAEAVGVGAVKYADLSSHRTTDYKFLWDKMLATDGNTATYMQYAYARCRAIFRKADIDPARFRTNPPPVVLAHPAERALGLQLLRFEETLVSAAQEYLPHLLTAYLWDLAKSYSVFFTNCPVLKAETPALRDSRLLLCDLTARTIQTALGLLGIRTVERM
ncbi:MAG TPA: arginine--tRNA ligase [Gemmataceae bacterium]